MKAFYVVTFDDAIWCKTFSRKVNAVRFARKFGGKVAYGTCGTGFAEVDF
jgi:hypothetical protein